MPVCPAPPKQTKHHPDNLAWLSLHEIRTFFARRPWLRTGDWEEIDAERELPDGRRVELNAWINGYLNAKG